PLAKDSREGFPSQNTKARGEACPWDEFADKPRKLPLGELEATPRAALAILLAFLHAAITREVTGVTQRNLQAVVVLGQGTAQTHDDRAGLPAGAAAVRVDQNVHLPGDVGHFQRAKDRLAV